MNKTTATAKTPRNATYLVALVVVHLFLLLAALGSFTDIVIAGHKLGLTWQAWTLPGLADGIALMGKLGRSRRFSAETRRAGLGLMGFGGAISVACNVYAGANLGQRLYGVLLVVGFLVVESYAGRLAPAPLTTAQKAAITKAANAAARATTATKTRKPAAKKATARRPRDTKLDTELDALVAGQLPEAPVSPAPSAPRGHRGGRLLVQVRPLMPARPPR